MEYGLKESTEHGNPMFPFSLYHVKGNEQNGRILHMHWHDEIEMLYLRYGNLVFEIDGIPFEMKCGQSVIINSKKLHTAYSSDHGPWDYYAIVFDLKMLFSYSSDIIQKKYIDPIMYDSLELPQMISGENDWEKNVLKQITKAIAVFEQKNIGYELMLKSCLYNILSEIISNKKLVPVDDKASSYKKHQIESVKKAIVYIQEHYHMKLTVQDIADEANMSKHHFSRLFKSLTGMTVVDYINFYRIKQAAELIKSNENKITEIAITVGFDNVSYFIKTFKRFLGYTPSKHKQSDRQ